MYKYYTLKLTRIYDENERIANWARDYPSTTIAIGDIDGTELFAKYPEDTYTNEKGITYKVEKSISADKDAYTLTNYCSQYSPNTFKVVNVGDSRDCRGVYNGTYITSAEYKAIAQEQLKAVFKEAARRENAYYSQLWV